jgi:hypothetical protein
VDSSQESISLQINENKEKQSFFISVPWAEGYMEMRFPETIHENNGFYFMDHDLGIKPIEELKNRHWGLATDSSISYSAETRSGLRWSGTARVVENGVELHFNVFNSTERTIYGFHPQMCLTLSESSAFGESNDLSSIYTWCGDSVFCFDDVTPNQQELERKFPWVIMLTKEGVNNYLGNKGREEKKEVGWWVSNEQADYGIIYKESLDKKHLVGIAWLGSMNIITNSGIPCLHSVPSIHGVNVYPGQRHEWVGKIYLMKNDSDSLKKVFLEDMGRFKRQKAINWFSPDH